MTVARPDGGGRVHVGAVPVARPSDAGVPSGPVPPGSGAMAGDAAPGHTRGYDRVGGTRLTGLGAILLAAVVGGAASPPQTSDRQVLAVVWVGLLAALVVGVLWPLVAIRRIGVTATSPRDATVGDEVTLAVDVHGRSSGCEVRSLDPAGPWRRSTAPGRGDLPHVADRRGVFQAVRVEVRVTAPLGILAAHRVHDIELPVAVEVAPRPLAVSWAPASAPTDGGPEPARRGLPDVDLVRSVRPYVVGDPAHLVHWPSSARTGSLVVREMEPPAPVGQAVVLDLRDLGLDIERAAAYALGAARSVLAVGGQLVLCTCEASGPVTAPVRTPIDAGRRMARAVVGPPGAPPPGWPVVEIGR